MKKHILLFIGILTFSFSFQACNDAGKKDDTELNDDFQEESDIPEPITEESSKELEETDLVESGTYTGTAKVVDQQQNEVYLQVNDTTTIELYFSKDTKIMKENKAVAFDQLQQGQRLQVEVERSGQSLKPIQVKILE